MNIDFNEVIQNKLQQMEAEGVIQKKIEESLEASIMKAIDDQLSNWQFRNSLGKQLEEGISRVASDCGLSAYNTFITEKVRAIVDVMASEDLGKKIETAVSEILVQRYENVKLSDIFHRFREYVMEHVDASDKYERQNFVSRLDVRESGCFTCYTCKFSEQSEWDPEDSDSIEIRFSRYREDKTRVGSITIGRYDVKNSLRLGYMSEFERFVTNLYFNGNEIEMDVEEVDATNDDSYIDY